MNDWPESLQRLVSRNGYRALDLSSLDDFTAGDGSRVLFVSDDPKLQKEVLDLAVILPELLKAYPRHEAVPEAGPEVAVLAPQEARAASARLGTRKTPALVFWRDGHYIGALEGLLDWTAFAREFARLLAAPPTRLPSIGIVVASAGATSAASSAASCH